MINKYDIIVSVNILLCIAIFGEAKLKPSLCGLRDQECHRKFFQTFAYYSKQGIPEIGVPVLDPIQLANVTVSIPNVLNLTLVEGQARGISDCLAIAYETFIDNKTKVSQMMCNNITVWGTYELTPAPLIKESLGDVFNGNGNIRLELEKWYMDVHYPFVLERHENGDIYMKCLFNEASVNYSIENIKLDIENVKLAFEDISNTLIDVLTKDWRFFEPTFGRYITDRALEFYYMAHNKFFDAVPAKYFIIEDLSPYL